MVRNPDPYKFGNVCKTSGWKWKRFARETETRFISRLGMLVSVLHNQKAMANARAQVHQTFPSAYIPECLTLNQCKLAQQACGVLTPFKVATRLMEGNRERSFASC